jgi:apolipoprotein N-acyltransferase
MRAMFTRFSGAVLSAMLLAIAFPLTLPDPPVLWGTPLPQIQLPGWDPSGGFAQLAWVAFFALIPLLEVARTSRHPREAFAWGYLSGAIWLMLHLAWFSSFGVFPVIMAGLYLALPVGAFVWLAHLLLREPRLGYLFWGLPAIWCAIEYLRGFGAWTMPWNFLGYTQVRNLPLVQLADTGGVYLVSFVIVLVNTGLFLLLAPLPRFRARLGLACIAGAVFLAAMSYGELRLNLSPVSSRPAQQKLRLALVQGGLDTSDAWEEQPLNTTIDQYVTPSISALTDWARISASRSNRYSTDIGPYLEPCLLVVWPESVLPRAIDPRHPTNLPYEIRSMLQSFPDAALLMGSLGRPQSNKRLENGCMLVQSDGRMEWPYSKLRLVPYGEVVPFRGLVRFLDYPWGKIDIAEGRSIKPIRWRGHTVGTMVCYDNCWPFISRAHANQGAEVLIVMTNNSWYKLHSGIRQHCDLDVMRAIESRRPFVRCSTTGWSHIIDPCGRVLESTRVAASGSITRWVEPAHGVTAYMLLGDLFAQLCLFFGLACVLYAALAVKSEGFL